MDLVRSPLARGEEATNDARSQEERMTPSFASRWGPIDRSQDGDDEQTVIVRLSLGPRRSQEERMTRRATGRGRRGIGDDESVGDRSTISGTFAYFFAVL